MRRRKDFVVAESERVQNFEVYRHSGPAQTREDNSSFWFLLVLIGLVALGVVGFLFAGGGGDDADAKDDPAVVVDAGPAEPAPQSVFDRLDWIQEQEGAESALSVAENQYLVEYPNAPNLKKRIEELKKATTVGEDAELIEAREDARMMAGAGRNEEALQAIERILERTDYQDAEANYLKAKVLLQTGDTFGAQSALEEAEALGHDQAEVEAMRRMLEGQ